MVFEATYLVAVFTAGQTSLCCGQNFAQMSKVFRPSNKSNGMFICFLTAVELTASECGLVHPPYAKPPLVSSSGPAWGLYDSIKGNKFKHISFSHDCAPSSP